MNNSMIERIKTAADGGARHRSINIRNENLAESHLNSFADP